MLHRFNAIKIKFNFFKKGFLQRKKQSSARPDAVYCQGSILDGLLQKKLSAKTPKIELASAIVEKSHWMLVTVLLSIALIICLLGFVYQTNKYENNLRLVMVKLYPNGNFEEERVQFQKMPSYFASTLYSLMSQYVERRYSKLSDSITADYGFAYQFMSPTIRNQFLNEYHAKQIASQWQTCADCTQTTITVENIQHYEDDGTITNAKSDHEYRSTVFATAIERAKDGSFLRSEKKILTLVWRIRPLAELNNDESSIKANPIGLVILQASAKDVPALPAS